MGRKLKEPAVVDNRTNEEKAADDQKRLRHLLEQRTKNFYLTDAMEKWNASLEKSSIGYTIRWLGYDVMLGEAMVRHTDCISKWVTDAFAMVPDEATITFADRVNMINERVVRYREDLVEALVENSWRIEWDKSTSTLHNLEEKAIGRAAQLAARICRDIISAIKEWRDRWAY